MCTEFCTWIHLNHQRMPKEVVQERRRKARRPLEFCTKLYALQLNHGRYFLHAHPLGATSWQEQCIQSILGKHGVMHVKADQCQYGLMSRDAAGNGLVRKATGIMTNFPCIAMKLQQRCSNRSVRVHCRHVRLEGRIKAAQIYPEGLCQAICRGLCQQLEMDQRGQVLLAQFEGTEQ